MIATAVSEQDLQTQVRVALLLLGRLHSLPVARLSSDVRRLASAHPHPTPTHSLCQSILTVALFFSTWCELSTSWERARARCIHESLKATATAGFTATPELSWVLSVEVIAYWSAGNEEGGARVRASVGRAAVCAGLSWWLSQCTQTHTHSAHMSDTFTRRNHGTLTTPPPPPPPLQFVEKDVIEDVLSKLQNTGASARDGEAVSEDTVLQVRHLLCHEHSPHHYSHPLKIAPSSSSPRSPLLHRCFSPPVVHCVTCIDHRAAGVHRADGGTLSVESP